MTQNKPFWSGLIFVFLLTAGTAVFLGVNGKEHSFQLINGSHHAFGDFFFRYFTYAGDGMIAIPLLLYCLYRKKYFVAVLAGFIISSLIAQFLKRMVFPDELRPIAYLSETFPVHVIDGVKLKRMYSFPSGHASTAFTMALLLTYIVNRRVWSFIIPLIALLAGYSRVYLGQHWVTDVLAGMGIGIISAMFSVWIYEYYKQWKLKRDVAK